MYIKIGKWDHVQLGALHLCIHNKLFQSGVFMELQNMLGRALHIVVCQLHFVELPFRHLFMHFDGASTGILYLVPFGLNI